MSSTKRVISGLPSHGNILELGVSGDTVQIADGAGLKLLDIGTVAAAGSTQGDAGALADTVNIVTAADGTKGVVLPAAEAGKVVAVYNSVATNGLKVYPATGDDINDGTANAAITIEGKTLAILIAVDTSTWAAVYTANT